MAVPKIDEPLGRGVVTVCDHWGLRWSFIVADWEQLGAVWEKSVATAVTAADAW